MARRKSTATAPEATKASEQQEPVTLVGRLCADPVLRHTKSGKPVSTIRVAVNAPDTDPTFHSVVVWNRTAEVVCEYLRKGRRIEVLGLPQQRTYNDSDGEKRTVDEISAFWVDFVPGRRSARIAEKELS